MAENETMTHGAGHATDSQPNAAINLAQYMTAAKATKEETVAEEAAATTPAPEPEKSPLEQLREKQEKEGTGAQMDPETFQVKEEVKELRNPIDTIEREEGIQERLNEEDEKWVKRKALVLLHRPSNPAEYVRIEYEIEHLQFDDEGKPFWEAKTEDALGNEVDDQMIWFTIRTEEYGPYDPKTEALYSIGRKPEDVMKAKEAGTLDKELDDDEDGFEEPTDKMEEEKKLVQILIDKTGYGSNPIEFTDAEKKTIYESDQILVTSTKKFDIASIKINVDDPAAPKKTFQATAREHQLSDSLTTVCFPMSGFHAQVSGMSFGEMRDIVLNPNTIGFDNSRNQISVLYNKLKNISCEPFKDIDDFMRHFAYSDFTMALYGLYVSTFPEMQTVTLTCGNKSCTKKSFDYTFNTRSIIKFNLCPDQWLTRYKELVAASPYDYERIQKDAPVNNVTYLELPISHYVIGIGPVTLWDYLYKLVPINDDQEFVRLFGPNVSESDTRYLGACMFIRKFLVPDGHGGYDEFEDLKDELAVMNNLPPEEAEIIRNLAEDLQSKTEPFIGLENVVCPNCGAKTRILGLDIGTLLFHARETLQNTAVDVTKWRLI